MCQRHGRGLETRVKHQLLLGLEAKQALLLQSYHLLLLLKALQMLLLQQHQQLLLLLLLLLLLKVRRGETQLLLGHKPRKKMYRRGQVKQCWDLLRCTLHQGFRLVYRGCLWWQLLI